MANSWGTNPIILDTASSETSYTTAKDAYKTAGATDYHTGKFNIIGIKVEGANADSIILQSCKASPVASVDNYTAFFEHTVETGNVTGNAVSFAKPFKVNGIFPKTISSGAKVYIYLE